MALDRNVVHGDSRRDSSISLTGVKMILIACVFTHVYVSIRLLYCMSMQTGILIFGSTKV